MAITGLNRGFSDYFWDGVPVVLISLVSAAYGKLQDLDYFERYVARKNYCKIARFQVSFYRPLSNQ